MYMYTQNVLTFVDTVVLVVVTVLLIRQGEPDDGLGEDMYAAHKAGEKMPDAVEFDDDDPPPLREMKEMITAMTSYYPDKRLTSTEVYHQTRDLYVRNASDQVPLLFPFSCKRFCFRHVVVG